ncbi:MAG: TonB-dependent receptor family protein [Candidatus Binatia bacterium]
MDTATSAVTARQCHAPPHQLLAIAVAFAVLLLCSPTGAQDPADAAPRGKTPAAQKEREAETVRLEEQQVVGEREEDIPRFLPDVKGPEIFSGKKTTVIDPEELPQIVNDNYRQVLSRVPGLNLSEDATPLVSIGYRGLDPHRTQFTLVLKDGIPIAADMFGYPESYYLPPIDSVENIEFIHGGAALLYGPQPGGALNFITKKPNPYRKFSLYSNQTFGSDNFYSTYNAASGTVDPLGYYVYYYQKQGDGFREANSDFSIYSGSAKLTYALNDANRLLVAFDGYNDSHGEPGGLRLTEAPNAVLYQVDRNATSRFFDEFALERYIGWGIFESDLSNDTLVRAATWGGRYTRSFYRQRGGGFGTLPSGPAAQTNQIEQARFNSFGLDTRVRHDWSLWNQPHTLTAGIEYYYSDAPRTEKLGAAPDARDGQVRNESFRQTNYGAIFAENRFVWGDFQFIPALRLENYAEAVTETVNVDKQRRGVPLADESNYDFQPLFGIGAVYTLVPTIETYANISSAYRPQLYSEAVATSPTLIVAGDLSPSMSYQYEIGFRGNPMPWVYWDTSLFYLEFDNQIGTVQLPSGISEVRNVGRARHYGWEVATEVGSLHLYDYLNRSALAAQYGDLSLFGSLLLLDAEFVAGPFDGKTPAYAPDYIVRAGFQYLLPDVVKASLLTTAVANQYGNDNNTQDFFIPAYNVWDLTMEANVWGETVALYAGVNNVFNENYYARIRSDGIQPAYQRNYYGGFKLYF